MKEKVLYQYEAIRRSGRVNMIDVLGVKKIAMENGFNILIKKIEDKEYSQVLEEYDRDDIKEDNVPSMK